MLKHSFRGTFAAALLLSAAYPSFAVAQEAEDEIIVTGSPLVRSVDEAITGVSVLTGEELQERLDGTIGETLKYEPGVSSTFFGAGASRPIIRGQGGDRVRVLTNGIGSIDASSASPDHAVAVEPAQAERVEVLRGAALLRYGSSGSGGIVNVIDGRIPTEMPENGPEGAVRLGASTVDTGHNVAGSVDLALSDNIVLHLDAAHRDAGNYYIPVGPETEAYHEREEAEEEEHHDEDEDDHHDEDEHDHEDEDHTEGAGRLDNSFTESTGLTAGLSFIGSRGFFGASVHHFESNYGLPGGHAHGHGHDEDEDEDHDEEGEHHDDDHDHDEDEHGHGEGEDETLVTIDLEQTRFDVNAAYDFDGIIERVQFFGGYADYKHTEFEGDDTGTVFANEGYEGRLELIQAERNGWAAAYGAHYRNRDFSAIGAEAFVPPTETRQLALYTFQEKDLGDMHVEGAARYENTRHENTTVGVTRDFDLFSVSAGGDIHMSNNIRLGGTVFRTERAPTTEELFSNGPHLATRQFEVGNVNLGKETATGIEAAFRHRHDWHFLTVNLFYTDYSDYIYERATGAEEDGLDEFVFTAEDAKFSGLEVHGGTDIGTWNGMDFELDAVAEYVRAKTDSGNLPRIPPLSVLAGIQAKNDVWSLRAEVDYAAKQNKITAFELPTDDYTLVNLSVGWTPKLVKHNIRFGLSLDNVFDAEARQHASNLKDQVPLKGRNLKATVRATF